MSYEARNGNRRLAMESPGTGPPQPMTVEEYARFDEPEDGYSSELFQGIVIREPPPGGPHGRSQSILARRLGNWMVAFGRGEVFVQTGFIISDGPGTGCGRSAGTAILGRRTGQLDTRSAGCGGRSTLPVEHAGSNARKDVRLLRDRSAARMDGGPQDPHRDYSPGERLGNDLPGWRPPRRSERIARVQVGGEGAVWGVGNFFESKEIFYK